MENRYDEIKEYIDDLINDIENMKHYEHKIICLFSMIDSFIQNYSDYDEKNNKTHFCNFILKFANSEEYWYLNEIEPVTLMYDMENKNVEIIELEHASVYYPESEEIIKLREKDFSKIDSKILNKHRYVELIYCCRSKLVHEEQSAAIVKFGMENEYNCPVYFDFTSYWKLIFPYKFLKELFLDCIQNYLEYQKNQNLDPFHNNLKDRKSFYAFYD